MNDTNPQTAHGAAGRLTEALMRVVAGFSAIRTLRRVAASGLAASAAEFYHEGYSAPDFLLEISDGRWHFPDERVFTHERRHETAQQLAESVSLSAQNSIDAASLVLAHAVLDDLASECLRITAVVAPKDWEGAVDRRKIELAEMRGSTYEETLVRLVQKYVEEQVKEGLVRRLDLLHQKCRPGGEFVLHGKPYRYDEAEVRRIDTLRHEVLHRGQMNRALPTIEGDLKYLDATCRYVVWLVNQRYLLPVDLQGWMQANIAAKATRRDGAP